MVQTGLCRSGGSGLSYSYMRAPVKALVNPLAAAAVLLALAGCGLVETGATAASGGASAAEQAKEAKQTEAKLQQQINAAYQQDAAQRKAAEAQTQ
jgi:hypothetical protein